MIINMNPVKEIKMPRGFFSKWHGVGMQRTCKLVDEWSERYSARVEVCTDDDGFQSGDSFYVERRYRVAAWSEKAYAEQAKIGSMMNRIRVVQKGIDDKDREQRIVAIVIKAANWLMDNGYSEEAIYEVFSAKILLPAGIPGK